VPLVYEVLDHIKDFSARVLSGQFVGATGKPLKNVISIGIGGSYLGPEFVFEAMKFGALFVGFWCFFLSFFGWVGGWGGGLLGKRGGEKEGMF
jgi:hypothetical protein